LRQRKIHRYFVQNEAVCGGCARPRTPPAPRHDFCLARGWIHPTQGGYMTTEPLTNPVLTMTSLVAPKGRDRLAGGSRADALYSWINRVGAAVLLVLLSPVMLAIAWRIWREDGAPVLFAHWRVGQKGRLFRCFKFRSMVRRADLVLAEVLEKDPEARREWERDHKLRNDPRVLRIGQFLRQSSLDELPQLLNVVRGEMHLVGPRPVVVQEIPRYGEHKRHYFAVKPGMTGLWQVSGRNNLSYAQRVALDARYVETRSLWMDLRILVRTVSVLITRDGAC
jgi:lipopolysaccharide/colanic/teichoic acid biosynthesis glycosyltransferase